MIHVKFSILIIKQRNLNETLKHLSDKKVTLAEKPETEINKFEKQKHEVLIYS